jgi:hypothetical protein
MNALVSVSPSCDFRVCSDYIDAISVSSDGKVVQCT